MAFLWYVDGAIRSQRQITFVFEDVWKKSGKYGGIGSPVKKKNYFRRFIRNFEFNKINTTVDIFVYTILPTGM